MAVAVPQGRRYYANGKWLDEKEMYANTSSFDPDAHIEITEEEFYHIPGNVVWDCNTEEGCKEAFEALWVLCKRYEGKFDESNPLPLLFWHKSIDLVTYSSVDRLYGFSDNGEQQDIYLTESRNNGAFLRRVGDTFMFFEKEVLPTKVFDCTDVSVRKDVYDYLNGLGLTSAYVYLNPTITIINIYGGDPNDVREFTQATWASWANCPVIVSPDYGYYRLEKNGDNYEFVYED